MLPAAPRQRHLLPSTFDCVAQIAESVREQGPSAFAPGGAWYDASQNLNGEQLAYVAAFATGALLAFGDRPKPITYA
jgi:hypothetical protein